MLFRNNGTITSKGVAFIGVISNKVALNLNAKGQFRIDKNAECNLGHFVRFARGTTIFVSGRLIVGEKTYIQPNTLIVASESVSIGSNCAISWNVQILDTDFHTIVSGLAVNKVKPVSIGNNVLIGANSIILKGVTLGNGSVVAAGSVVTKSFPENVLIGGNPAKILRENISWIP